MPEGRHEQIVRLLETVNEHLPVDKARRDTTPAGFVHDTLAPAVCPTCEGVDSLGCTGCGGRGSVEVRRTRDPYAVEKVAQYGLTGVRHEAARERDAQIARLEQQTRPPWTSEADELAELNARPFPWEVARARAYRQYDYAALDRGLGFLRQLDPEAHQVITELYIHGRLWKGEDA